MASVGSLRVDLGLNSAEFQAGMSKAEASMTNFGRSAAAVGKATDAVGATSARVMARQVNLAFQLQDVGVSLAGGMNPLMVAAQQGSQILGIYGMGQGGLGAALRDLGSMAGGLVSKMWPIAAVLGVASAAIAAMTGEINKSAGATVGFGDVALATWQLFAESVYNLVQPAIAAIGGWFSDLWGMISPAIATAVNGIIGGFVGAFEAVKATWSALPSALGDIMITTANVVVKGVEAMVNKVGEMINGFLEPYNAGLASMGQATIPTVGTASFGGFSNPFAGAGAGVAGAAADAFAGAQKDYIGGLLSAVGERARSNIAATKTEVDGLGGSAKAANDNLKGMADDGLSEAAQQAESLGSTIKDAFKGFVTDIKDGKNWIDALGDALGKVADRLLDMTLDGLFSAFTGGLGGAAGIGGMLGGLFGFANGGSFQVGGSGGIDSQVVAFKASPNETVSVTKPGQERAGAQPIVIQQSFPIQGAISDKTVLAMVQQGAAASVEAVKAQFPGWQTNLQIHGAP